MIFLAYEWNASVLRAIFMERAILLKNLNIEMLIANIFLLECNKNKTDL